MGSSTRSELGGFTAPLLLVTTLARYWGLQHRCQFSWTTDSKSAITKVTIYTAKSDRRNQRYPAHSDYVTTIQELCKELRRPFRIQWIKGHQDDDKTYEELPRDAKHNIDADKLATKHQVLQLSRPMRKTAHLPSQQISLTINGTRYPGNWDNNLRWSINGFYLKKYLSQKHRWTETIWQTIDFSLVRACYKPTASEQRQWFKFMHDLQPLGKRKQHMGNNIEQSTMLDKCPCCNDSIEDQQHFLTCERNPNSTQAYVLLTTYGSKFKENHKFVDIMTDCIKQWLLDPNQYPSVMSPVNPNLDPYTNHVGIHMMAILQAALEEQHGIGWLNAIRGFLSKKWQLLASTHTDNINAPANIQDGRRRIGTIIQRIQAFVRSKWEGRNNALHKHNQSDVEKFRTLEAAEIRHYHSQPHLLPVGDQHYCSSSLIKLLRSRPAYRRRWLRRVRKVRSNMIKDQCRQATITTYFIQHAPTKKTNATPENNNNTKQRNLQIAHIATSTDSQPKTRPKRTQGDKPR